MKAMMDLKSAIIEETQKMAQNQQLVDKIIDGFLPRMKRVVELEGGFVEPTGQFEVWRGEKIPAKKNADVCFALPSPLSSKKR